jgi:predicted metallo-beta-lactamase superfamily hydrolase
MTVIKRSVDDIIGTYKGETIYRYVELDDGRTFMFESIAVEESPGVFHADNKGGVYIIVDKYLLYREIPV